MKKRKEKRAQGWLYFCDTIEKLIKKNPTYHYQLPQ